MKIKRKKIIFYNKINDPQGLVDGTLVSYPFLSKEKKLILESHHEVWMPTQFSLGLLECLKSNWLNLDRQRVLDLACGSGILGIACLKKGASEVFFTDLNPIAIKITKINCRHNNISSKSYQLIISNCFQNLPNGIYFDFIISNPPTAPDTKESLEKRLSRREHISAYDWNKNGEDGRLVVDSLIEESPRFLTKGGLLLFVTTSKQGSKRTTSLLNKAFGNGFVKNESNDPLDYSIHPKLVLKDNYGWGVIKRIDLPLASWYNQYLEKYQKIAKERGEAPPVYKRNKTYYQKLYFILAKKR